VDSFAFGDLPGRRSEVAVMDIRAILVIGGISPKDGEPTERFGNIPFACLDVLGMSVEERVVQRLRRFGVTICSLITDSPAEAQPFLRCRSLDARTRPMHAASEQLWQAAEQEFQRCAEDGAELVVVLRLGAYVEVDYEEMIQHHLDRRSCVTQAVDADKSALDLFVLSASARMDAAELFQSRLQRLRRDSEAFQVKGYVNRLHSGSDLRRLAVDGLLGRNAVAPQGREVKPGIWLGPGARVHKKARVVAPAYVGSGSKIRASALITRGTAVEQHAVVDCGTVVENTTILPFTCLGAGLDAMHCVVGFRRVAHLARNVEVELHDEKLVGMIPLSPVSRLAGSTAALFAFIPREIYRGFVSPWRRKRTARSAESLEEAESSLKNPAVEASASDAEPSEFPSNFAVVRRYGDH
jgi:carbonic anhydrase/acetyltransferase-like protein (isoleucine patch superfamily)